MNKEMFWQLIDESREACKDNIKGMAKYLEGRLSGLSLDEVKSYCGIFDTYHRAAGLDGVASVGNLMNHEMLTDDGFTDFRNWLIAQGKEIYLETMKNPEILAEKAGEPIEGWYEFELLGYAGMRIVEQMTGDFKQSFVQLTDEESRDILDEIVYGEYADKQLSVEELQSRFPKFAERFIKENEEYDMESKLNEGNSINKSVEVKVVDAQVLRTMHDEEGIVFQGCGGEVEEWIDGVNEMLTEAGILKDGTRLEDVTKFEHDGLTNLLFKFGKDDKIDMGKLAMWRLQTHAQFGGTWLSDYVPNRLDGYVTVKSEPVNISPERKNELYDKMFEWICEHIKNDKDLFLTLHGHFGMTKEELHDHSIESLDDFFSEENPEMNNGEGMGMTM